ncbi:MAG: Ig-like domain-containing protein [Bacteroidetes bacterium]|nr:Ig-like domain-containing protein [Bacteroidota bacterium]
MKYRNLFSFLAVAALVAMSVTGGSGCANIIPPQGGPRDSLPPVLLKADPGDSARNFTGSKITFTFDEFVEVQNITENLMVSPLPVNSPVVDYKLKTVTLRIKDSLEANTTYSFNFGNAIRDYTEGNPYKNFTYTFSTGRYLDSLQLTGKVVMAETGKTDSTLIVMLHTNGDDSAVIKEKPRYITKVDSKGNFTFKNLPAKKFYVYALKDEGGTRRYLSNKQLFAFADKPVEVASRNDSVLLYVYAAATASTLANVNAPLQNLKPKGPRNNADKRLKFQSSPDNGQQDLLSNFFLSFDLPLRNFDSTKLRLYTDTTFIPVTGYAFTKDSTGKKVTLSMGTAGWKPNTLYQLILDKDFAEDTAGKKLLKTDTLSFKTKKQSDYGTLKIRIRNLDMAKNPVLIFLLNGSMVNAYPLSGPEFNAAVFSPGEYELRILYDRNKNGVWDPGQFFGKHLQPELAKPIERKLNVKPGWGNEFEIAL